MLFFSFIRDVNPLPNIQAGGPPIVNLFLTTFHI
jgi:hypothetical protein